MMRFSADGTLTVRQVLPMLQSRLVAIAAKGEELAGSVLDDQVVGLALLLKDFDLFVKLVVNNFHARVVEPARRQMHVERQDQRSL